jgi:hypothetical protein
VYLENKRRIGKVDEILGKIQDVYITIKMDPGVVSSSFQPDDVVYVGTDKLLPLARFTNPSPGGGRAGGRGGRCVLRMCLSFYFQLQISVHVCSSTVCVTFSLSKYMYI